MVDTKELLGALLRRGMTDSSQKRIENSLGDDTLANILEQEFGAAPQRQSTISPPTQARVTPAKVPAGVGAGGGSSRSFEPKAPAPSGKSSAGQGGLGSLFGDSFKGALGAGALALLGTIAMRALRGGSPKGSQNLDSASRLVSGMRKPENDQEQQQVQSLTELIVKAMVNAAKSDGRIDEDELQKVVGELQGDGVTEAERDFLLAEVRKPMCTEEILRAVPNRQAGAQIYAASLLAIEVDTPAEKAYLEQLAVGLGLDNRVVGQIHTTLGMA
jgi:uncharacterized membrane protein YebE (DUF533 family)